MKRITIILLLISIGCSRPKHNLEIYLLKSTSKSEEGIPAREYFEKQKIDFDTLIIKRNMNYDTINNELIYAGKFDITKSNLESKPFITNDEIEFLDLKSNEIKFTVSAAKKIASLSGKMTEGHQFVVTDNKRPVFGGYFWSVFSSYGTDWNTILHVHKIEGAKPNKKGNYQIFEGKGMGDFRNDPINFRSYLINTFCE